MTELDELIANEVASADLELCSRIDFQRRRWAGHAEVLAEVEAIQRDWNAVRETLPATIRAAVAAGEL